MKIYFICTGNTCRSPMAEALLRQKNLPGVEVKSAGIHAIDGLPISQNSEQLLKEADLPYTEVSKQVREEDLEWADLVLTMTTGHRDVLQAQFPEYGEKLFTLKEYAGMSGGPDIQDPFGGTLAIYRGTFDELAVAIEQLAMKLTGE